MTEYYKSCRSEMETVSFYIFDRIRGIKFNVKSDNSNNDFHILTEEDSTKLYNIFPSVIDSLVENNTKIIVPFDLDSQVGYVSNISGLLQSLKEDIKSRLRKLINEQVSTMLYIHVPFCEQLCMFCICHRQITSDNKIAMKYLKDSLFLEIDLMKS